MHALGILREPYTTSGLSSYKVPRNAFRLLLDLQLQGLNPSTFLKPSNPCPTPRLHNAPSNHQT